jgi:hypothetical protein
LVDNSIRFFTYCWVMVEAPWTGSPLRSFKVARAIERASMPSLV